MFIHLLSRQIILTHDMTELKGYWSHKYFPCAPEHFELAVH